MSIGSRPIGQLPIAADEPVAAGGAITGTAAITLGALTTTSAGNLPINDTLSVTLGALTLASQGNLPIKGTLAATLAALTSTSAGNLPINDTLAVTLGALTLSAQGNLPIAGSLARTLGDVTMAGTGIGAGISATADITLAALSLSATATIGATAGTGTAPFGYGGSVHRQGDTRWDGVREAREEARRLFDEVAATAPAKRKEAVQRASVAVADADRKIRQQRPIIAQVAEAPVDAWYDVLQDLEQLQAFLAGLAEQDRIRAAEAREAAERWALIERELALEAQREEELMIVMAMAL